MRDPRLTFSLPRWRLTRWLADAGRDVPDDIRVALVGSLYGTLPIFFGGVINTISVAALITARIPEPRFIVWLAFEATICLSRLAVLVVARRAAARGRPTPTDLNLLLAVAWSASLGLGCFISLTSGDWVVASLACLSAGAMVGGTCFRNFAAPRLTGAMTVATLGPCCIGAALSGEPILLITFLQIPLYLAAMTFTAFRLNRMLIATMQAERENGFRAHHDGLTGLSNRAGLASAMEAMQRRRPQEVRIGLLFLDLDGFKSVNDTHGHDAGDRLLRDVGDRLRGFLGEDEVAARIGGDEFVLLCVGRDRAGLITLAEAIIARVSEPYGIAVEETVIGVSIGIAMMPDNGDELDALLRRADAALYRSKSLGKGRCTVASRKVETVASDDEAPQKLSA